VLLEIFMGKNKPQYAPNLWRALLGSLCLLSVCASGCTGYMDDPFSNADQGESEASASPEAQPDDDLDPGTNNGSPDDVCAIENPELTRLNRWEYLRTVADLFPDTDVPELTHPESPTDHGFDNYAADLESSTALVETYLENGRKIAKEVMKNPDQVLSCRPEGADFTTCGRQFLEEFGPKIFRRPITDEELEFYARYFESPPEGASFEEATQLTLQLMLGSPEFAYRIEAPVPETQPAAQPSSAQSSAAQSSAAQAGDVVRVDPYSLASRMSYFLWGTMPDETLMAAAANGDLDTAEGVAEQADRMLQDPKALEAFLHFHEYWLKLDELNHVSKSDSDNFDEATREAMREETELFISEVLFRDRGTLDDLMTSKETFVNARLADIYGLPQPAQEWERVTLDDGRRAGLFTQPAFLAAHAHPDKPSPVLRGAFVLQELMCLQLGAPPEDANAQANAAAGTLEPPYTNREYYDTTTMQGGCASCHTKINGVGYSFENYDTMGRWRETEPNDLPIDASGGIYEWEYDGAVGMMHSLAQSEQVEKCVTEKWMTYARGSNVLTQSPCVVEDVLEQFRASGRSLRELPLMIVTHPDFAKMRIEPTEPATP
jgi:hypothetical protein